jgi:hypothetical protein
MPKPLTTSEFVLKARAKHGNRYDYSLVIYKNNVTRFGVLLTAHFARSRFTIWPALGVQSVLENIRQPLMNLYQTPTVFMEINTIIRG